MIDFIPIRVEFFHPKGRINESVGVEIEGDRSEAFLNGDVG